MKPEMQEITRGIGSLSPDSVRRLDRSFALSKDAQGRIYRKTLRKTSVSRIFSPRYCNQQADCRIYGAYGFGDAGGHAGRGERLFPVEKCRLY